MNIDTMDHMPTGVITQNLLTGETIHINVLARDLLKIPLDTEYISLKSLFQNKKNYDKMQEKVKKDFERNGSVVGDMFLKTFDDTFIEIIFRCVWVDKENDLVCYIFKSTVEVVDESLLNFREITEFLPTGVLVMSLEPEITIVYANSENYKILGLAETEKKLNVLIKDIIYEEDVSWTIKEIYENLHNEKDVDIEFRVKTYDNDLKWVRLCGRAQQSTVGNKLFYCTLKDLSIWREINSKTHLESIMMRKIAELSEELMFRVNLETNVVHFIGNQIAMHDGNEIVNNFPDSIIDSGVIHKDDIETFKQMAKCFEIGIYEPFEMRYKTLNGEFEWFKVLYNFVNDNRNKPLLVTGKLSNINEQKLLEEQAKKDLLTGFYNKITTEIEINCILEAEDIDGRRSAGKHTLVIIDIDYFKSINDNLGHHFGDIVLNEVATDIRNCFRKGDILGRIGGDEFIVLMKNIHDKEAIINRVEMICNSLRKTYSGNENSYSISASIGISSFPKDGITYEDLYKKADLALYKTKENGKDGYTEYNTDMTTETVNIMNISDASIHRNKRRKYDLIDIEIVTNIFNLLYETKDLSLSLTTIIEHIGIYFQADKCYIYETHDAGESYQNDYRWVKAKNSNEENKLISVPKNSVDILLANASEDGIYATSDIYEFKDVDTIKILEDSNVQSIILIDSLKELNSRIIFGLHYCNKKRTLNDQETQTLLQIARMIFTALSNYNIITSLENKLKSYEDSM